MKIEPSDCPEFQDLDSGCVFALAAEVCDLSLSNVFIKLESGCGRKNAVRPEDGVLAEIVCCARCIVFENASINLYGK